MIKYLLAGGVGVGIGYYAAVQGLEKRYTERVDEATENAKEFYRLKYAKKAGQPTTEEDEPEFTQALIEAVDAIKEYQGNPTEELTAEEERAAARADTELTSPLSNVEVPENPVAESILQDRIAADGGPVQYNKISTPAKPAPDMVVVEPALSKPTYEITTKDFIESETGYTQSTFMYYLGDDVLANEADEVIEHNIRENELGADIISDLKEGGTDTVYLRNDEAQWEREIIRDEGSYADVAGTAPSTG